jgi:hypothetical protein
VGPTSCGVARVVSLPSGNEDSPRGWAREDRMGGASRVDPPSGCGSPPSRGEALAEGQSPGRQAARRGRPCQVVADDSRYAVADDFTTCEAAPWGGLRPTLGPSPRASPIYGGVLPTIGPPRFPYGAHRMERERDYVNRPRGRRETQSGLRIPGRGLPHCGQSKTQTA